MTQNKGKGDPWTKVCSSKNWTTASLDFLGGRNGITDEFDYGYLWWIIHPEKKIYAAIGNSGNVMYVNPEEDIVVAVSSYFKPTVFDRVDFIEDVLLPWFR